MPSRISPCDLAVRCSSHHTGKPKGIYTTGKKRRMRDCHVVSKFFFLRCDSLLKRQNLRKSKAIEKIILLGWMPPQADDTTTCP
jgi:hypothetical protein